MPRRRNREDELNFEIHVDDSCMPELVADELASYDVTDRRDTNMASPKSADHLRTDPEGSDATIFNSVEADDAGFGERRESGFSNVSYESDRRVASRPASDFRQSVRNSYGSVSDGRQSIGDSEQMGGRVSTGDSSSQHDQEDDVFSDHSPRSSTGSNAEADHLKQTHTDSRRMTGGSRISDMQPYDPEEEFIPTARETPRPPFRSPSSVKAMQMNSPPPSVNGSARSNRRATRSSVSRIGSPAVSTQFSPKKTPPRFKRNTPPLVLLHVTLLPLRWPWGNLMDNARPSELSDAGKNLREAWKQLQARVGDTVSDRGVLLPHPQNDFEILEERLLEAMELPLKRRARILECGHYLGPANEIAMAEDELVSDEEGFEDQPPETEKRHWCSTCQSDIRYDSLGEGKIFRTKVYASNGLMKAGAWDACWKEMERVDVELEPIVDPSVVDELERIAATQEREAIEAEIAASTHVGATAEDEDRAFSPENVFDSPSTDEDSRRLYEERMREIYGESPEEGARAEQAEAESPEEHKAPTSQAWAAAPPPTTEPRTTGAGADLFRYGFRDVVQLIVFILCVFLLQYLGIGFDRKGKNVPEQAAHSPPTTSSASQVAAGNEHAAKAQGGNAGGGGFRQEAIHESYAACASALEVAQASLALAAAPATVTVTETLSVLMTASAAEPTAAVPEQLEKDATTAQDGAGDAAAESTASAEAHVDSGGEDDEEEVMEDPPVAVDEKTEL